MNGSRWPVASRDDDFAPYLDGRPEVSVALFWRFIALARAAGPASYERRRWRVSGLRHTVTPWWRLARSCRLL